MNAHRRPTPHENESVRLTIGRWCVVRQTTSGWKDWVSAALFGVLGFTFQVILAQRFEFESPWPTIIGFNVAGASVAVVGKILWNRPIFAVHLRRCKASTQEDDASKPLDPPTI